VESERNIDLVVMDFAMPGMNGAEVARQTKEVRPDLPVLFVTGFADRAGIAGVDPECILGKPFGNEVLAEKVKGALSHAAQGEPAAGNGSV
jgi:CheY-like chemotaxis protein